MAAELRRRLAAGEWATGSRIPTEAELTAEYRVSRATIRAAIHALESLGYLRSIQGSGTYVLSRPNNLRGDLRNLDSMTSTIEQHAKTATSEFRPHVVREATEEERKLLSLNPGDWVLATARDIRADGELVAYSEEAIPMSVVGDADLRSGIGPSIFEFLAGRDRMPATAETELHASYAPPAATDVGHNELFVRLDQVHRDKDGVPVMMSSSYYLEGRFTFGLTRTR